MHPMNAKRELIQDIALLLMPASRDMIILDISKDGEIEVNLPRLADGLLAAGYRKQAEQS